MTWPFGQVTVFTNLARSSGGAGAHDGGAAAWPAPDFALAMEHASYLVLRRGDDARGLVDQQVLRTLPAEEAVDRGKPVREAPVVLPSAKHGQHSWETLGRPMIGRRVQGVAREVVYAAMAHREDLPVLLPFIRLGTGVSRAKPRHLGDLCRGQPIAALKYGLARFCGHAGFDQLVLRRGDLRDESLDDRMEHIVLAALENGPDQRHEIGDRLSERPAGGVVSVLQRQCDDSFRMQAFKSGPDLFRGPGER